MIGFEPPLDDKTKAKLGEATYDLFESVKIESTKIMKARLEDDRYYFSHCPQLSPIFEISGTLKEIQAIFTKHVLSRADKRECTKEINKLVSGLLPHNWDIDREIEELAHNLYMQHDSAYAFTLAKKTNLKYFIYQGSIIRDSRDFCVAHSRNVWSIEEAEAWTSWTPAKGIYPPDYVVKAEDINSVPSYINYPSYIPLLDRGGYNCRHYLGFIMDSMAFRMRPDLKH